MAYEEPVVELSRRLPLGSGGESGVRALQVPAIEEHSHAECDSQPGGALLRGDLERADIERITRDLRRFAPVESQTPDLRGARPSREEIDRAAVRAPVRARIVGALESEPARLSLGARQIEQPEVGPCTIRVHVRFANGERDEAAIGRDDRIAETAHPHEVPYRERRSAGARMSGRGEGEERERAGGEHEPECRTVQTEHRSSPPPQA